MPLQESLASLNAQVRTTFRLAALIAAKVLSISASLFKNGSQYAFVPAKVLKIRLSFDLSSCKNGRRSIPIGTYAKVALFSSWTSDSGSAAGAAITLANSRENSVMSFILRD